jgi:hypothetical protein
MLKSIHVHLGVSVIRPFWWKMLVDTQYYADSCEFYIDEGRRWEKEGTTTNKNKMKLQKLKILIAELKK